MMARGNADGMVFEDDHDRRAFLDLLTEGVERFGHTVHGYCLMGNHFHLAVRTAGVPLSHILQNLMFRYARWFNRRHGRTGHLFQGRFKSVLVEEQRYLLELVRYIHLNPVRAGLVNEPGAWPWSGHRAYLGQEKAPWLDVGLVLGVLGGRPAEARRRYERFVAQGMREGRREEFHRGGEKAGQLGDEGLAGGIRTLTRGAARPSPRLDSIEATVCAVLGLDASDLAAPGKGRKASEGRSLVGLIAQETRGATLAEVAARFGRDPTTLSAGVSRMRFRAQRDARLAGCVRRIHSSLGERIALLQA